MTTYSPTARSTHQTLVAATADTVNIPLGYPRYEVYSHVSNTATIWYRADGTTAVAGADGTFILEPGQSLILSNPKQGGKTVALSLISAGTPSYSVTGVGA